MTKRPSTRELLRNPHHLGVPRQTRQWFWPVLVVVASIPGLLLYWQSSAGHAQQSALETRLAQAEAQRDELVLQLRMTQASEQHLTQRNADLSARIEHLTTELAFFRQQKN